MFRFIFVAIFLILYLILSIPVFFVEWLIGKFNPHARDISSLRIVQWGFKVILKMTGVKVTVIGEENVPDEPVLFIGNHRSFFDILLTYSRSRGILQVMWQRKRWKKFRFFLPGCVLSIVFSLIVRIRRKV